MLHGRGASSRDILSLYPQLQAPEWQPAAPQAPGHSWYPQSFMAPLPQNQPQLDQAIAQISEFIDSLTGSVALLGFSQGACLALEVAARHPRRYAAVIALTGALITTPSSGSLQATPVFLGCGDPDAHVPFHRVQASADALSAMGAQVELRRYPGLPHTINQDEIGFCKGLLKL